MNQFAKNFISEWRRLKLPTKNQTVIAAVSGGADSVSLLAVLHELQTAKKLNLEIIVGHFNHQLRGADSEADAEFVKNLSNQFGFHAEIRNPQSAIRNQKGNLEQTARRARYNFLFDLAEEHQAFAVLTAHTLNDQAETFLMRLVRGSGTDGLGAIKVISNFEGKRKESTNEQNITLSPLHPFTPSQTKLIRPLLAWATREATENYCQKLDIEFRRDTMNDNVSFTRVRVRKQLIPFLKTFNPKIIETLATTAGLFHTDAEQLNSLATDFLQAYQFSLPIKESLALSPAVRRRVLRIWLKQERGSLRKITATHLLALESLILKNEGGRTIELPNKGFVTRRSGRLVYSAKVEKNDFDN